MSPLLRRLIARIDDAGGRGVTLASHLMTLYALALHATGPVVECGVGAGFSTLALLAGAGEAGLPVTSYDIDPGARTAALRTFRLEPSDSLLAHWTFVPRASEEAPAEWANGEVGLLFLDTSHRYAETTRELFTWAPKLRADGVICGHDYLLHLDPAWPGAGVKRAVDQFAARTLRFELQVLERDHGLFILWPRTT